MAMIPMTVHVCMTLTYPMRNDGSSDYMAKRVWLPEAWSFKPSDDPDRIYIGAQQVAAEIPDDFNPTPKQVAALEAEKAKALAEYQQSVALINERLSKLLAITNG